MACVAGLALCGAPVEPADATTAFLDRVEAYAQLHRGIEAGLPAAGALGNPWLLFEKRERLAWAIQSARDEAAEGEFFTPEVAAHFRDIVSLSLTAADLARMHAGDWPVCDSEVNGPLPAGTASGLPFRLLHQFPRLPQELEYRAAGADLVLWDAEADVVVDVLRDVFVAPSFV